MENFITKELLEELGFKLIKYKKSDYGSNLYGEAHCKRTNGMTIINWNTGGHSCTYFGEKLNPNISVSIKKDGGTRFAFNGYVFNEIDFRKILTLTW